MKPVASVKYISLVTTGCKMMWSHGALVDEEEKGCVQTSSTWNMSSVSWRHQQQHWKIRMSRAKAHWNGIWYFQEKLSLMCFSDLREEFMRNVSFLHPPGFLFRHHCAPSYFHAKLCSMTHKRRMRSFARRSFCFFWIPQHIFHFHPFFFLSVFIVAQFHHWYGVRWAEKGVRHQREDNKRTANVERLWSDRKERKLELIIKKKSLELQTHKYTAWNAGGREENLFGSRWWFSLSIWQEFN